MAETWMEHFLPTRSDADRREYERLAALHAEPNPQVDQPHTTKLKKHTTDSAIAEALITHCCSATCVQRFFTAHSLRSHREWYFGMNERERMNWLIAYMREHVGGVRHYSVTGRSVCRAAFGIAYGVSRRKLDTAIKYIKTGMRVAPPHFGVGMSHTPATDECFLWLHSHLSALCDRVSDELWLLPMPLTIRDLFHDFVRTMKIEGASTIATEETFRRTLHNSFAHVRSPRVGDLPRCDECSRLRQRRLTLNSRSESEQLEQEMRSHSIDHSNERKAMMQTIATAPLNAANELCLTLDYSKSVRLPHIPAKSKELSTVKRLELQFGGAIVYSTEERFVFTHLAKWPKGSELMATLTFELIRRNRSTAAVARTAATAATQQPARSLRLFVDNAGGEFKNRWYFGFLGWLIAAGWFTEVTVSMLLVGHTHTAIDQLFSVLHRFHQTHQSLTPVEWLHSLDAAYPASAHHSHKPRIAVVESVTDWKNWLSGALANYSGHSTPQHFRFTKDGSGDVSFQYKRRFGDEWSTNRIRVFHSSPPHVNHSAPLPLTANAAVEFEFANRSELLSVEQFALLQYTATTMVLPVSADSSILRIGHPSAAAFLPPDTSRPSSAASSSAAAAPPQADVHQGTVRPLPPSAIARTATRSHVALVKPSQSPAATGGDASSSTDGARNNPARKPRAKPKGESFLVESLVAFKDDTMHGRMYLIRW